MVEPSLSEMYRKSNSALLPPNIGELPPQQQHLATLFHASKDSGHSSVCENSPVTVFRVLDTHFGTGHATEVFLTHYPHSQVYSVYKAPTPSSDAAVQYLQQKFPNRLKLIHSSVLQALGGIRTLYPNMKFDIIFVDIVSQEGEHMESLLRDVLVESKRVVSTTNRIILNHTVDKLEWLTASNIAHNTVWDQAAKWGLLCQLGTADYALGRGMSWGQYIV